MKTIVLFLCIGLLVAVSASWEAETQDGKRVALRGEKKSIDWMGEREAEQLAPKKRKLHPEVQEKMWAEVKQQIGQNRLATLADRKNMPYFQAVLLELLRYISHVPLAVPHYTTCDTSLLGIPVPKDMTVYINLWAVHHDPLEWQERGGSEGGQLLPNTDPTRRKLMVFGGGRRVCLGEALAKNRLFLFAWALVQNFRFQPSADHLTQLPDLDPRTYDMGLVLHPKHYQLRAFQRH